MTSIFSNITNIASALVSTTTTDVTDPLELINKLVSFPVDEIAGDANFSPKTLKTLLRQFDYRFKQEIEFSYKNNRLIQTNEDIGTTLLDAIPSLIESVKNPSIFSHLCGLFKVRGSGINMSASEDVSESQSLPSFTVELDSTFFHVLLSLLQKHTDSISDMSLILDIFVHMSEIQLSNLQNLFKQEPIHISLFLDVLKQFKSIEFVSHTVIYFLSRLTTDFPLLQKLIAFENGFEILFPIINAEDGLNGNSIIVLDALNLISNMLSSNSTTISYFLEIKECYSQFITIFLEMDKFPSLKSYSKQALASWLHIFWFLTVSPVSTNNLHYCLPRSSKTTLQDSSSSSSSLSIAVQDELLHKLIALTFSPIHPAWIPFLLDLMIHFQPHFIAVTLEKAQGPSIWTYLLGLSISCSSPEIRTSAHNFLSHCLSNNIGLQLRLFILKNEIPSGEEITKWINTYMDSLYPSPGEDDDDDENTHTHHNLLDDPFFGNKSHSNKSLNISKSTPTTPRTANIPDIHLNSQTSPSTPEDTSPVKATNNPPASLFGFLRNSISSQALDSLGNTFQSSLGIPSISLKGIPSIIPSSSSPTSPLLSSKQPSSGPTPILNDHGDYQVGISELTDTIFQKFAPAQIFFSTIFVNESFWSNILEMDYSMIISTCFHIAQSTSLLTNAFSSTNNKSLRLELLPMFPNFSTLLENCSSALRTLLAHVVMYSPNGQLNKLTSTRDGSLSQSHRTPSSSHLNTSFEDYPGSHSHSGHSGHSSQNSPRVVGVGLPPLSGINGTGTGSQPGSHSGSGSHSENYIAPNSAIHSNSSPQNGTYSLGSQSHKSSTSRERVTPLPSIRTEPEYSQSNTSPFASLTMTTTNLTSGFQKLASLVSSSAVGVVEAAKNVQSKYISAKSPFDTSAWPVSWTYSSPKFDSNGVRPQNMTFDSRILALSTLQNSILQLFSAWIANCPEALKLVVSDTNFTSQLLVLITEKVGVGFSPHTSAFILLELLSMGLSACESDQHLTRELSSIQHISTTLGGTEALQNIVSSFGSMWNNFYLTNTNSLAELYPIYEIPITACIFDKPASKSDVNGSAAGSGSITHDPNNLFKIQFSREYPLPPAYSILPGFTLSNLFRFSSAESVLLGLEKLSQIEFQSWLHNVLESFSKPFIVEPPLISHDSIKIPMSGSQSTLPLGSDPSKAKVNPTAPMIHINGFHKFWVSLSPLLGRKLAQDATLSSITKSIDILPHLTELYLEQQAELSHCYYVISELEKHLDYTARTAHYIHQYYTNPDPTNRQ